jgi:hypothetical protein
MKYSQCKRKLPPVQTKINSDNSRTSHKKVRITLIQLSVIVSSREEKGKNGTYNIGYAYYSPAMAFFVVLIAESLVEDRYAFQEELCWRPAG